MDAEACGSVEELRPQVEEFVDSLVATGLLEANDPEVNDPEDSDPEYG